VVEEHVHHVYHSETELLLLHKSLTTCLLNIMRTNYLYCCFRSRQSNPDVYTEQSTSQQHVKHWIILEGINCSCFSFKQHFWWHL